MTIYDKQILKLCLRSVYHLILDIFSVLLEILKSNFGLNNVSR